MQIQNNYNAYSGTEYHKSHTHHITECVYDHEEKTQDGGGAGAAKSSMAGQEMSVKSGAEQAAFYDYGTRGQKQETEAKKGPGMLRRIWDAMGEDGKGTESMAGAVSENRAGENVEGGIPGAASAFRHLIPAYITEKWETLRDRVKAKAGAAFENFDKKKDAFLALSDFGGRFQGKKEKKPKPGKGLRRTKPELLSEASETHLMDSYSKKGEYCRLNDNLSYRRERHEANRRAFSERAEEKALYSSSSGREERLDKRL